jgi:NADH-quinone oxidoreductase subunit C
VVDSAPNAPKSPSEEPGGGVPASAPPVGATSGAPAEYPPASGAGRGMFGIQGSGDTSGFGGLVRSSTAAS